MNYVIAAYIVIVAGLGFYWWTLSSRHRELRSEVERAGVQVERESS